MARTISLTLVLMGLWMLLSGPFSLDHRLVLFLGIASVILVTIIASHMDVIDHEGMPVHLTFKIVAYWIWLAREIAKSNWDVARLVLDPKLPISPRMIRVKATQRGDLGRVIHANSITLTPGTVSVELEEGAIVVHAISRQAAEGTLEGAIDRRVSAVEGQ